MVEMEKDMGRLIEKKVVRALVVVASGMAFLSGAVFADSTNSADEKPIFACPDFPEKIQECEEYVCEVVLAGVPTTTQIRGRKNGRCVVVTTVGVLKKETQKNGPNPSGKTIRTPVTTICEYDQAGMNQLSERFQLMKDGRYDFSSKDTHVGEYNCHTATEGQIFNTPIPKAKKPEAVKASKNKSKTAVPAAAPATIPAPVSTSGPEY